MMSGTVMSRRGMRSLQGRRLFIIVAFVVVQTLPLLFVPAAKAQYRDLSNRYVLDGTIGLEYEKRWVSGQGANEERGSFFTQNYELRLTGPIIDSRLATFSAGGTFLQRSGGNEGSASRGFDIGLSLLNDFRGVANPKFAFLAYMPHPISLMFSRYSGTDFTTTNYSFSTTYYLPLYFKFFSNGKFVSVYNIAEEAVRLKFNEQGKGQNTNGNSSGIGGLHKNGDGNGNGNDNRDSNRNDNENENGNDSDYLPEQPAANKNQNQNQNENQKKKGFGSGLKIPFPLINIDYDRNISESDEQKTDRSTFDARARMDSQTYSYALGYNRESTKNTVTRAGAQPDASLKTERLTLDATNHIHNFLVYSNIEYVSTESSSTFHLSSHAQRSFVKDNKTVYDVAFGLDYNEGQESRSYSANASGSMRKYVTPSLLSASTVSVIGQKSEVSNGQPVNIDNIFATTGPSTTYGVNLAENVSYSGLKGLVLTGGAHISLLNDAVPFGVNAGFYTTKWRRLVISGDYSFDMVANSTVTPIVSKEGINGSGNGLSPVHILRLRIAGLISPNMTAEGGLEHRESKNFLDVGTNKSDRVDGKVNWFYGAHRISLSGYVDKQSTVIVENGVNTAYSGTLSYNTYLRRNSTFSLMLTYDRDNTKSEKWIQSRFAWYYGKLAFSAEYEGRMTRSEGAESDSTEHRIFLRATRTFRRIF